MTITGSTGRRDTTTGAWNDADRADTMPLVVFTDNFNVYDICSCNWLDLYCRRDHYRRHGGG